MRRLPIPVALLALATMLAGCAGHPFIRSADADSVEVGYGGSDVASAWPLARQHCAQFGRVARLIDFGLDVASFKCDPR